MKIFVTGATGFIGKHIVKQLLADNHSVTVNLLKEEISPFTSDVNEYKLGNEKISSGIAFFEEKRFDGIIHLASVVQSGQHRSEEIELLIDSNIKFGAKIIEIAIQAKVKWMINTGTYWQNYNNKEYSPVNFYAATKQAFEDIAKFYIDKHLIKFCTIRLFDTYGPDDTRPKIFNIWNTIAKSGHSLDMSPGEQIIDISHIDDIVSAFILLVSHLQNENECILNGSVYVVKAEQRYTLKNLALIFERVTNQKLNINWGSKPYRENEVMIPWENGVPVPGWKPFVSIEEGIENLNLNGKNI